MGLREINAARTKTMIVDAAMKLFVANGYGGTTMEDIARSADIGSSTLYRYFPTKDSVVMSLLGDASLIADALRERPADEPVDVALGHALVAFLSFAGQNLEIGTAIDEMIAENVRARGWIMEWLGDVHAHLVLALKERLTGPNSDVQAGVSAWAAVFVLQRSVEEARRIGEQGDAVTIARRVMRDLADQPVVTPRL